MRNKISNLGYFGFHACFMHVYSEDAGPVLAPIPRPLPRVPLSEPRRHSEAPWRGTKSDFRETVFHSPPAAAPEEAPEPEPDASFDRLNLDAPLNPVPDPAVDRLSQRVSQMSLPPLTPLTSAA